MYLDGIAKTAPFVYDTLVGFNHTIEARDQSSGATAYTFASWSDGGARQHIVVVPATAQTYTATYTVSTVVPTPAFIQASAATPQGSLATVPITYPGAQAAGDTNIVAIGWNDTTSTIVSVTDSAGNAYQLGRPDGARARRQSGDLLRAEHQVRGRGREHGDRRVQQRRALRRRADHRIQRP